ncbi:ZIP family metal transporter [Candidatus Woesearchaeota archaeon]|nr:ZIP family metal transporter [Candidatus Woesearchaeota archaeon]
MISEKESKVKLWIRGLLPLLLLGLLLLMVVQFGPLGVLNSSIVPIENIFIEKVIFSPEHIILDIFNDGPEPVTIAQVLINDAYWQFEMSPSKNLEPLESGKIELYYPWVEGDFEKISLISRNGIIFEKEIEIASITPVFNRTYVTSFVLLGIYVGVIPVFLGLLWLPFLRNLRRKWYDFLLALTIGILVFLGFDAIEEAFKLLSEIPQAYNSAGIFVIGFLVVILTLAAISHKRKLFIKNDKEENRVNLKPLIPGYLVALGIGLHNLGEGLAIGSAYAIGEIALGSLLVIGFMIHNVTEGVAIIAPLLRITKTKLVKNIYTHIILMGILAGVPTIFGTLIGGFSYSPTLALLFLAIGAGAILYVAFDILKHKANSQWMSLCTITNTLGFLTGLLIMYTTGFLILG